MSGRRRETRVLGEVRDRVRELRRVPAGELLPHPENWRVHPVGQRVACAGLLRELGYADALLAVERSDGQLQLIDGHLRAETTPDALVPVLIVDLDEDEARRLLLSLDPLAMLAEAQTTARDALLQKANFQSREVLAELSVAWQRSLARFDAPADPVDRGQPAAGRGTGSRDAKGSPARSRSSRVPRATQRPAPAGPLELTPRHCVLIDCRNEAEQLQLLERLTGEGLTCRALIA